MKRFGKYRGVVFDNQDPMEVGRVKALVPKAGYAKFPTGWATPSIEYPKGWKGPPAGTKVWVEFEAGDLNLPIWTGIYTEEYIVGQFLKTVVGSWEDTATVQRIIESAVIKLGKNAVDGLLKTTFGNTKYNLHTHLDPVSGQTGPPSLLFVQGADDTIKTKGE